MINILVEVKNLINQINRMDVVKNELLNLKIILRVFEGREKVEIENIKKVEKYGVGRQWC